MPARDGHESDSFGVVANLLNEGRGFFDNFVEPVLAPLLATHQTHSSEENVQHTLVVSILFTATMS
jgi:hypothetical protein